MVCAPSGLLRHDPCHGVDVGCGAVGVVAAGGVIVVPGMTVLVPVISAAPALFFDDGGLPAAQSHSVPL